MRSKLFRRYVKRLALLAIAILATMTQAGADQAVVVGIDQYPQIPGPGLKGCVNDARRMETALTKLGFKVKLLVDGQATRKTILATLDGCRKADPSGRFTFYFAGYGARAGLAQLLTCDSTPTEGGITAADLKSRLLDVQARSRTVIIDAGFDPGSPPPAGMTSRYFTLRPPGSNMAARHVLNSGSVCILRACNDGQTAYEIGDGQAGGIMTRNLIDLLTPERTWGQLHHDLAVRVRQQSGGTQVPVVTALYEPLTLFDAPRTRPTVSFKATMWNMFNMEMVDKKKLELTMSPDASSVHLDNNLEFQVKAGAAGWLVVVEVGPSGRVHVLFPEASGLESARVSAGQVVALPSDPGSAFAPDQVGFQRIRAILYGSSLQADKVLQQLPVGNDKGIELSKLKDAMSALPIPPFAPEGQATATDNFPVPFYSHDQIFEVQP